MAVFFAVNFKDSCIYSRYACTLLSPWLISHSTELRDYEFFSTSPLPPTFAFPIFSRPFAKETLHPAPGMGAAIFSRVLRGISKIPSRKKWRLWSLEARFFVLFGIIKINWSWIREEHSSLLHVYLDVNHEQTNFYILFILIIEY